MLPRLIASGAIALVVAVQPAVAQTAPVRLTAVDGLAVSGTLYPATRPKAVILLFHQAGSSKGEYATIAPRLAAAGYDALAIDQRVGGGMFGPNQTAAHVRGKPGYAEAQKDLETALAWGLKRGKPVILWGSSYSAALIFRVAAEHGRHVAAVLAFSPGEYLGAGPGVAASAARVTAPVFVTSASDPEEVAAARTILAAVRSSPKVQYVPRAGVHGSSTLIPSRNAAGAAANWTAVRAFLGKVAP